MDAEYDRFYVGDKVFNAMAGRKEFRDNLVRQFPAEEQAIDRYMALLSQVGKALSAFGMAKVLKPWQRTLATPYLKWKTPDFIFRNTYDVLSELTDDQDLIAVICGQWGDMGLPPRQSVFMVHAMIARHYLYGGFYPDRRQLEDRRDHHPEDPGRRRRGLHLRERGADPGRGRRGQRREDVRRARDRVSDGDLFRRASTTPSGICCPPKWCKSKGYALSKRNVRPSIGHLCLYIGCQGTAEELGLPKTNFWIYPHNDFDRAVADFRADPDAPFPVVYVSFPSAKDPDYLERHPGTATIEIVAPAPYEQFEQWQGTTWGKRGEDYEALKAELSERLLRHLYDKLPSARGQDRLPRTVDAAVDRVVFRVPARRALRARPHARAAAAGLADAANAYTRPVAHRPGRPHLRRHRRDDGGHADSDGDGRSPQDGPAHEADLRLTQAGAARRLRLPAALPDFAAAARLRTASSSSTNSTKSCRSGSASQSALKPQ